MQSQLEEAAENREREKLRQTHQLADTTFRVNNQKKIAVDKIVISLYFLVEYCRVHG